MVKTKMSSIHEACKRDSAFLDRRFPSMPFHPGRRASFVYLNLLRVMAIEAHSLKKGDGMDFCHAVIAIRILKLQTLHTNRKLELQAPAESAWRRIDVPQELNQMITDMEVWLKDRALG